MNHEISIKNPFTSNDALPIITKKSKPARQKKIYVVYCQCGKTINIRGLKDLEKHNVTISHLQKINKLK